MIHFSYRGKSKDHLFQACLFDTNKCPTGASAYEDGQRRWNLWLIIFGFILSFSSHKQHHRNFKGLR